MNAPRVTGTPRRITCAWSGCKREFTWMRAPGRPPEYCSAECKRDGYNADRRMWSGVEARLKKAKAK